VSDSEVIAVAPATETAPALALRRWRERDAPALVAAHRDVTMRRWLTRPVHDEDAALKMITEQRDAWVDGSRFTLAVVERPEGVEPGDADPIGSVSIRRLDRHFDVAEVGYWVAAQARGRSVAPRAMTAALDWAAHLWRHEPLRRFELIHTIGNDASCRVAQKLGFALEEELPASVKWPEPGHLHVRPFPG
jgi:RimJ/RimL family protein N-acetyltransferase